MDEARPLRALQPHLATALSLLLQRQIYRDSTDSILVEAGLLSFVQATICRQTCMSLVIRDG